MIIGLSLAGDFVETAPGSNIHLTANNGFNAALLGLFVKLHRAVHIAVIGQRNRGHPRLAGPANQVADPSRAIQQAILTVYVKMDKGNYCILGFT